MSKRLVKKSLLQLNNEDVVEFIEHWFTSWNKEVHGNVINQILSENPENLYNGKAYRYIGLRNDLYEDDIDLEDDKEIQDLIDSMSEDLLPIVPYSSFAKDRNAVHDFITLSDHELERSGLILEANISNGLNFESLAEDYLEDYDLFMQIREEKEVISTSQIEISECKIIGFAINSEVIWIS